MTMRRKIRAALGRVVHVAARVVADQDQAIGLWCVLCLVALPLVLALPAQGGLS
ncbi:hypothetical protein [Ideonella oryzae]|uniref:Uncharacterized protein n=1 Tax=Ideonella oryzae TaxID=2937441 RepID=A0ABT1BL07_9BURK|nr:hypothetical protein [Ideonella oryzae]MCO5976798.1 hypothetical protein [Ideonella oryzae]